MAHVASSSPVVSSSSTLWATASKEWVIPAKPKPGRKPKKDQPTPAPAPASSEVTDPAGRRVQNRAAQRAFRERKQSQLAELQARIQQYEQGEIERNVALQTVAKRLKEENDKLREENTTLKAKIAQLEQERADQAQQTKDAETKRWRDDAPGVGDYADPPARKKTRLAVDTFSVPQSAQGIPLSFISSPPSLVSSPGSNDASDHCFSPLPVASPTQGPAVFPTQVSPLTNIFDFPPLSRPQVYESAVPMEQFDCGFCNDNTPCVCREIALQSSSERADVSTTTTFKAEMVEQNSTDLMQTSSLSTSTIVAPSQSILDNLPEYQPPIPLRRRAANPLSKSLFPVALPQSDCSAGRGTADCSGDPSNCPACADDVFGKAFCTAIGESVASQAACADCPSRGGQQLQAAANSRLCCGNPAFCRGGGCNSSSSSSSTYPPAPVPPDTIPTSDAWRQIKSHPNVTFADLSLLAEVVARRSKCTGPTVVISPALGSITPERSNAPAKASRQPEPPAQSDAILLSDPHAHYRQKERERSNVSASPPPRLVPHDELVNCARSRALREVHADGVREALRLLDTKFGRP